MFRKYARRVKGLVLCGLVSFYGIPTLLGLFHSLPNTPGNAFLISILLCAAVSALLCAVSLLGELANALRTVSRPTRARLRGTLVRAAFLVACTVAILPSLRDNLDGRLTGGQFLEMDLCLAAVATLWAFFLHPDVRGRA